ncbi:uncharacterized protein LOC117786839 [Drosophila innubila]|uniref:uncharacterized protein LOC117786839 n=1 Tax=Drosophila innubila TaxID=198719 RepID=UPI00148C087F|nr:uncharacterized protein LOC117786839 [Drosophila innubila]
MSVVPHLLYMFEFVVDDLVITQQNYCAPEEYPICVEIIFRNSVYVNICDRDYGDRINPTRPKSGKRCIFALESPVTKDDRLLVYVYKKRSKCCKFLVGLMEVEIKFLFDRVKKSFDMGNINWNKQWQDQLADMPKMKNSSYVMDRCDCYDSGYERREQLNPLSEVSKQMIPLFNLCNRQTGNIVLLMRLSCHGPTVVSAFWKQGNQYVPQPPTKQPQNRPSFLHEEDVDIKRQTKCYRFFACNKDKLCPSDFCEDEFDRSCPTIKRKRRSKKGNKKVKNNCICSETRAILPTLDGVEQLEVQATECVEDLEM